MANYEQTIFDYINNVVRYMKIQPLVLGGLATTSGSVGGPPGGFIGYLPQERVTYDYLEAETLYTPASGVSLIDNLNHIRYRVAAIEAVSSGGVNIYEGNTPVVLGANTLKFNDVFSVTQTNNFEATIGLLANGVLSDTTYSGIWGEEHLVATSGSNKTISTINSFYPPSLEVYLNGVRQANTDFSLIGDTGFIYIPTVYSGDVFTIDYDIAHSGYFHNHSQYVTSGDTYTRGEVDYFLLNKSDTTHTHVEADIVNLTHNAIEVQGVPIFSGIAPSDYHVIQYSESLAAFTTVLAEFEQQIVFPLGEGDLSDVGKKPFRVYVHDVGDNAEITNIFAYCSTAPTGNLDIDVEKNGSSILTAGYFTIYAGSNQTSVTTGFATTLVEEGDYFQVEVVTADSAADYLMIHIRFKRRF